MIRTMSKISRYFIALLFTIVPVLSFAGIDKEHAFLVHATAVFPVNGVMVAGLQFAPSEPSINPAAGLTFARVTLHWSVNSLAYPHAKGTDMETGAAAELISRETRKYAVVEPFALLEREIVRSSLSRELRLGHWQDVATIGSHRLTPDAVVFVPSDDTETQEKAIVQHIKIALYDGLLRDAIERYIIDKGALLLSPADGPVIYPRIGEIDGTFQGSIKCCDRIGSVCAEIGAGKLAEDLELDNVVNARAAIGEADLFVITHVGLLNISLLLSDPSRPLTTENCPPAIRLMTNALANSFEGFIATACVIHKEIAKHTTISKDCFSNKSFDFTADFLKIKSDHLKAPALVYKIEQWEELLRIWFNHFFSADPRFTAWRDERKCDTPEGFSAAARELYEQTRAQKQRLEQPIEWLPAAQ